VSHVRRVRLRGQDPTSREVKDDYEIPNEDDEPLSHMAFRAFAHATRHIWDTPEEDEAWAYLQE